MDATEKFRPNVFDIGLPVALFMALGVVFAIDAMIVAPKKPLDVVFILDEGAGLAESAGDIKSNWIKTSKQLAEGFDCRFAVVPGHAGSEQIPRIEFTADVEEFEKQLTAAEYSPSHPRNLWPDTDCLRILENLLPLKTREDAIPFVFLTTNSRVTDKDQLARIAAAYKKRGIRLMIQGNESDHDFYQPLYQNGGQYHSLAGKNMSQNTTAVDDKASQAVGTMLGSSRATSAKMPGAEQLFAGVKVKGSLALVCDISGSMSRDFPPLIEELRAKFPPNTPLILVTGCSFYPPRNDPQVRDFSGTQSGVDFSNDRYVYRCNSTTDAIVVAVTKFRRDTVMFNNDLQDGGSARALEALEELLEQRRFTLSGRSLNCDAPDPLKNFIEKSGGEFNLAVINRTPRPAVRWSN